MQRREFLLAAAAGLALAACGEDATSAGGDGSPEITFEDHPGPVSFSDHTGQSSVDVAARDNVFREQYIEVSPGTEVIFTNEGRNDHNVYPANEGAFPLIDTPDLNPGESASITFGEAGDFPYYCTLHATETAGMIGGVRVTE